MEIHILAVQARILLLVGIGVAAFGLWLGIAPATVAWRAAAAALAAMWVGGWLLRIVATVIEERIVADLAERQLAAAAAPPAAGRTAPAAKAAR